MSFMFDKEGETGDTDSSSGSGSSSQPNSPPNTHTGRASIVLPSALRDRLTFDYHLVVKRGRLSRLPAVPSAAQILESFVKWFARAGAWNPPRAKHDPPARPDMLDVSCRLNLLREVADGLRVYFDFILRGHLLYKQELDQYYELCGQYIDEPDIKTEPEDEEEEEEAQDVSQDEAGEEDMRSPKVPEYSHLPPDPDRPENGDEAGHEHNEAEAEAEVEADGEAAAEAEAEAEAEEEAEAEAEAEKVEEEAPISSPRPATRHTLARRLRSHKSAVSQSENEEPAPSTSTGEQRTFETLSSSVGSSGSSLSESWPRSPRARPPAPARNPLSQLLDKVAKWQIIPREDTEHLPCRVYGAIHLARLFVKLPDFLNATQMPDFKLKLILKHIDMFVQYLDEHSEWFGEMYYVTDGVSRSH